MTAVVLDVNLSLDGFAAAPGSRPGQPLGDGGDRLREWAMGPEVGRTPKPAASAGALICGRRTYETSLPEWGAGGPHSPTPVFVVTHTASDGPRGDSVYTFVTDGVRPAIERARSAAGDRDVRIMGGPALGQQCLAAGLVDEILVHLVPWLLTAGTPMFENLGRGPVGLEVVEVVDTPAVTHLHYRVVRG